ncbi:hypothetical protein [Marinimicrobium alkaliphilum]|uniref:hypothetical protein n=1 Tax=Marinimicrobium alkaliphilum TaxID=2202654 RepID=UPI000DBA9318|nr:hypothetical protein [Marinimicrobium alkaliphilum]
MKTKIFFKAENRRSIISIILVVALMLTVSRLASAESSVVEISYGQCDSRKITLKLVETPESSVFPESDFLSDTVFLRYIKVKDDWLLDQSVSDSSKKYSRQAVLLVENHVLNSAVELDCLDFNVRFNF